MYLLWSCEYNRPIFSVRSGWVISDRASAADERLETIHESDLDPDDVEVKLLIDVELLEEAVECLKSMQPFSTPAYKEAAKILEAFEKLL